VGERDTSFARLVTLAAHDLRTPLATIHGFAQTIVRLGSLEEPNDRYMDMIAAATKQLAELLDELSLAARIEGGRYEPNLQEIDTLELARGAASELGEERVRVNGEGGNVRVDVDATKRGVAALDWELLARAEATLVFYMPMQGLDSITTALTAMGRDHREPALVVERAGTPDERVVAGRLGDIAARCREACVGAPALLLVGPTVDAASVPLAVRHLTAAQA